MNQLLSIIAEALNAYLKLDAESEKRLQKLQGNIITVELLPLHLIFQCIFKEKGLDIVHGEAQPAAAKLCGTPLQMCAVMLNKENRQQFFADDVTITGDAVLGQQVIELFDELEIDWEEQLSRFIGDVPAYHVSKFLHGVGNWLKSTDQALSQDINDYLHEEIKWFPAREALADFFFEVDTLRMDADRIAARIANLKANFIKNEEQT